MSSARRPLRSWFRVLLALYLSLVGCLPLAGAARAAEPAFPAFALAVSPGAATPDPLPPAKSWSSAIQRVVSPAGIEVWLIREDKSPVISLQWLFRGGASQDPVGKEGLATLFCSMQDEGAGDLSAFAFQQALEDASITLRCSAGRDWLAGSLLTLRDNREEAFRLTALAFNQPRYDGDALDRMRVQQLAQVRQERASPGGVAGLTLAATLFPDHPYGRSSRGTPDSLAAITRDDLRAQRARLLTRDHLIVAASGAISPEELGQAVDALFAGLPASPTRPLPPVPDTTPAGAGEVVLVPKALPQTLFNLDLPGLRRDDPDWYAATVLNKVLGGGLGSRLMTEVREKRGLSYAVDSGLVPYEHSALFGIGGSTVNDKAGAVLDLIRGVLTDVVRDGITETELRDAQTYLTGAFPLQFADTQSVAAMLLLVRRDGLGPGYFDERAALINRVTLADIRRVAARLLRPDRMTVVLVGQPQGVTPTRVLPAP